MSFILPELNFKTNSLEPVISKETIEYHYGKHHQAYINYLNDLILGTNYQNMPIQDIIKLAKPGPLFNNAAQSYNHAFYWRGLMPSNTAQNSPKVQIAQAINKTFGDFENFKASFSDTATKHFGSGWVWLVKNQTGELQINEYHDADTPITDGQIPLLTLDVWEHAYYIDYRNKRADYIMAFWQLVNWSFVEERLLNPQDDILTAN